MQKQITIHITDSTELNKPHEEDLGKSKILIWMVLDKTQTDIAEGEPDWKKLLSVTWGRDEDIQKDQQVIDTLYTKEDIKDNPW